MKKHKCVKISTDNKGKNKLAGKPGRSLFGYEALGNISIHLQRELLVSSNNNGTLFSSIMQNVKLGFGGRGGLS